MSLVEALEAVALTNTGKVRDHNEDAVFVDLACGVAILADGMGGYNAGEVASGMAVSILSDALKHDF
jgi:protein phosphatase